MSRVLRNLTGELFSQMSHLEQSHVFAIVLLALLRIAGCAAVDEGTALFRDSIA